MTGAITFDFHDTLVHAEEWFELEVRELAAAFLRWRAAETGSPVPAGAEAAARTAYRGLRLRIMEHGQELPAERCVEVVLDELHLATSRSTIERGVHELMAATLANAGPLPGAIETVRALAGSDVPLGVVSSAVHHPFLEWSLDRFGLLDSFRTITTSSSAGYYKSRPEIYHQALAHLRASPRHSVHVGDSWRFDVQTARGLGMRTVWLSGDRVPDGEPLADLILANLVRAADPIRRLFNDPIGSLAVDAGTPSPARAASGD
jgi:HAD superfamily hydrolase (TIGR01509 family)